MNWISIKEKKPTPGDIVDAYASGQRCCQCKMDATGQWFHWWLDDFDRMGWTRLTGVTHWMIIPNPPTPQQ